MILSWISPVHLIEHELAQLREEGIDTTDLRRQWDAVKEASASPWDLQQAGEQFLQVLPDFDRHQIVHRDEPSVLDEIIPLFDDTIGALPTVSEAALADRIAGGWFGRAAGCLLGKPVEKTPREGIRELLTANGTWPLDFYITAQGIPPVLLQEYPWNRHHGVESLRENIVCMPEDDDMNYPMLNLSVIERWGREFTTEAIAQKWLETLPVLSTFTAERVAYLNCLQGFAPPMTALHRNPYREWIGAQIRGDLWGWVSPGRPRGAAALAYKDARLSHIRNGMYGEMFVAGMVAAACVSPRIDDVIASGLSCIPRKSRLADAIRFAMTLPGQSATWEGALDRLYERYDRYHWVHTINNAALVVAALLYGKGDFQQSVCNVVMGGWDTDSNGATVGSVVGTMTGARHLPAPWIAPLSNRIRSSMLGFDNSPIDGLAERTTTIALQMTNR